MEASFRPIKPGFSPKISIISNPLAVKIDTSKRTAAKYKKVGKETKQILLEHVTTGASIISVFFMINLGSSALKNKLFDCQIHRPELKI